MDPAMDAMPSLQPMPTFRDNPDRLLNEREAAAFLGYSVRCLQNWRLRGGGPMYVKAKRSVRYRGRDLLAWVEGNLRRTTSDPGPASAAGDAWRG